jgi:CxxC motif-containing protein (DUF1111 family)
VRILASALPVARMRERPRSVNRFDLGSHEASAPRRSLEIRGKMKMRNAALISLSISAGLGAIGCGAPSDTSETEPAQDSVDTSQDLLIGDHLSGVSDGDFNEAKAAFVTVEDVNDGLGPIFNDSGCGNCHNQGAVGGAGTPIERRFGRFDNGVFNPLANEGGSLRQLKTLGNFTSASGQACSVPLEQEPADATVHNVGRLTTPLFGLGLVDAMPDSFFQNLASNERQGIRGIANMVSVVLPDPSDPSQSIGSRRVGRFGWKAGVPNLVQFAADAYVNEMGITTQHCFKGTSITAFSTESAPNGKPVASGCDDNLPGVDDAVGSCDNGKTEVQDDVAEFTEFMKFLSPSPPQSQTLATIAGQLEFTAVGCNDCHTSQTFRTPASPPNGVPGNFSFRPFSDFLLHDMGSLGDQIGNAGDSQATTRLMRTAPLWGVRFRTKLLHDGRASDVASAVRAHSGQAASSVQLFNLLASVDQGNLVRYVQSL